MALGTLGTFLLSTVAAPLVTNMVNSLFSGVSKPKQTQQSQQFDWESLQQMLDQVPMLSYDDALAQAMAVVNPLFDQQMDQAMRNMDYQLMQRGYYGQLPGDVLRQERALDIERARAGQTANLAQQIYQQSLANRMAQQQMMLNAALQGQQLELSQQQLQQQAKQQGIGNLQNWLNLYYGQTENPLWLDIIGWAGQLFNSNKGGGSDGNLASVNNTGTGVTGDYIGLPIDMTWKKFKDAFGVTNWGVSGWGDLKMPTGFTNPY